MIVRAILAVSAIVLAGASLAMSMSFVTTFDDVTLRRVFVAVACAACALKLVIPGYFAATRRPWRSNWALVATWAIAFVLDASFVGAFMSTSRDGATRELAAQYEARREVERQASDALRVYKREADKDRRPLELVRADHDAAKRASGRCDTPAAAELTRCSSVAVYERELASHEALKRLKADADKLAEKLAGIREVVVYPEAARFGKMARAVAPGIEDAHVAALLWLLMLVLFEFGAMTAFKTAVANVAAAAPAAAPAPVIVKPAPVIPRHDALFKTLADAAAGAGALAVNKQADGRLRLAQKSAAQACGVSPRALGAALQDLANAGRIDLVTGSRGTFVRVVS